MKPSLNWHYLATSCLLFFEEWYASNYAVMEGSDDSRTWMMPPYFDALGIFIFSDIRDVDRWRCRIITNNYQRTLSKDGKPLAFPDRYSALVACVERAFEIRNGQLLVGERLN